MRLPQTPFFVWIQSVRPVQGLALGIAALASAGCGQQDGTDGEPEVPVEQPAAGEGAPEEANGMAQEPTVEPAAGVADAASSEGAAGIPIPPSEDAEPGTEPGHDDPEEWIPLDSWLGQEVVTRREYHPGGKLERIRTVLPGVEGPEGFHGPEMVYHSNGLMKLVKTWNHGQPEGHYRTWFPTGQVKREGAFAAGELHGDYVEYKKAGTKQFEGHYVHGQLHGRVVEYYHGERPKDESHWEYGRQVGVHRVWSIGEVITLEENYADDELHGVYRSFYPDDGEPKVEGTFEQGVRNGYWRGFDAESRPLLEEYYVDGKREGERKAFAAGVLVESSSYKNDLLHGQQEMFYEDGSKRSTGELIEGKRIGSWYFWNPDGTLIADLSGVYEDDRRVAPLTESND